MSEEISGNMIQTSEQQPLLSTVHDWGLLGYEDAKTSLSPKEYKRPVVWAERFPCDARNVSNVDIE